MASLHLTSGSDFGRSAYRSRREFRTLLTVVTGLPRTPPEVLIAPKVRLEEMSAYAATTRSVLRGAGGDGFRGRTRVRRCEWISSGQGRGRRESGSRRRRQLVHVPTPRTERRGRSERLRGRRRPSGGDADCGRHVDRADRSIRHRWERLLGFAAI